MKGVKPTEILDEVFGENNWPKTPKPPCKKVIGQREIIVKASKDGRRKEHKRTINVYQPMKKCFCKWEEGCIAAKSPDLNIAENFFNEIQRRLRKIGLCEGWPKNREQLVERIKLVVADIPKE